MKSVSDQTVLAWSGCESPLGVGNPQIAMLPQCNIRHATDLPLNSGIAKEESLAAIAVSPCAVRKCERQELNLHGFPHWILRPIPVCRKALYVLPLRRSKQVGLAGVWQAFSSARFAGFSPAWGGVPAARPSVRVVSECVRGYSDTVSPCYAWVCGRVSECPGVFGQTASRSPQRSRGAMRTIRLGCHG